MEAIEWKYKNINPVHVGYFAIFYSSYLFTLTVSQLPRFYILYNIVLIDSPPLSHITNFYSNRQKDKKVREIELFSELFECGYHMKS